MARRPVRTAARPPSAEKGLTQSARRLKNAILLLAMLGLAALAIFERPIGILLVVGLLPTLAAWLVDGTPRLHLLGAVAPLNLACALPFVIRLWFGKNTTDRAVQLLLNPYVLLALFGAAAFGWMLYWAAPRVTAAVIARSIERKRKQLLTRQQQLIEEWGEEVMVEP